MGTGSPRRDNVADLLERARTMNDQLLTRSWCKFPEWLMASIMLQYDRPTDTQHWNEYNRQVRDWMARLLQLPGAASFIAYRTTGEVSPNTITMLEFRSVEEARQATTSEPMRRILNELRSVGAAAKVLVLERSPFTPEPLPA